MRNKLFVATTFVVLVLSLIPETDEAVTIPAVNEEQVRLMKNYKSRLVRRKEHNQAYLILTRVKIIILSLFGREQCLE